MKYHSRIAWITVLVILSSLFSYYCSEKRDIQPAADTGYQVINLPLTGDIAERSAEISGLTWYKDQLILLPQYPDRFMSDDLSSLFKIPKKDITDQIDQLNQSSNLTAERIEFDEQGIPAILPGFQGYESIVFVEDRVYLTIEINQKGSMQAFLVEGSVSDNIKRIVLDKSSLRLLPLPLQIKNFAYESMIYNEDKLLIHYEANGSNLTATPQMIEVDLKNGDIRLIPFLNLEYRITDATSLDEKGYFWVINYYWPGDFGVLKPADDQLAERSDPPQSFSKDKAIERLVELRYSREGTELSKKAPLMLRSDNEGNSRNWEGIVRMDNRGFLLVTDKHPKTILAFVPYLY